MSKITGTFSLYRDAILLTAGDVSATLARYSWRKARNGQVSRFIVRFALTADATKLTAVTHYEEDAPAGVADGAAIIGTWSLDTGTGDLALTSGTASATAPAYDQHGNSDEVTMTHDIEFVRNADGSALQGIDVPGHKSTSTSSNAAWRNNAARPDRRLTATLRQAANPAATPSAIWARRRARQEGFK